MPKRDHPTTNAMRHLKRHEIDFEVLPYAYEPRGGTKSSSRELGVDEHTVIKTLIMQTSRLRRRGPPVRPAGPADL